MGLTLHYRLTLPGTTPADDVRARLAALNAFAATVGFAEVLSPEEYSADGLFDESDRDFTRKAALLLCGDPPDFSGARAGEACAFAFGIIVGIECEPATFGFIAPGSRTEPLDEAEELHAGEWFWAASCKTQYASMISNDHHFRCHDGLVRVLDHAVTLGIAVTVVDDSGYWEHRSRETLVKMTDDMNRLLARVAGEMERRFAEKHDIDAAIFDHPYFEHLEMGEVWPDDRADGGDSA